MSDLSDIRLIDLSVPLKPNPSEVVPIEIEYVDHRTGGAHLAALAGLPQEQLPNRMAWASEFVKLLTHAGTHIDAPYHYSPVCKGQPSRTIDELPLDWFVGAAACLPADVSGTKSPIGVQEIEELAARTEVVLGQHKILLFRTGAEAAHGRSDYMASGRSITPDAVRFLVRAGVRVIGTDAWSIDPVFAPGMKVEDAWAAHYVGYEYEFCIIERLTNLAMLPARGFSVACFPIKVFRGSAAWSRPVALIQQNKEMTT